MSIEPIKPIQIIYRAQPKKLEAKNTKPAIANLYQQTKEPIKTIIYFVNDN